MRFPRLSRPHRMSPADSETHIPLNPDHVDSTSETRTFETLIALANEHHALYLRSPNSATLDQAINHFCAAFDLGPCPSSKVDYVHSYFRLHHALLLRAQAQKGHGDTTSISDKYLDEALSFTPPGHHLRPVLLGLRGTSYTTRYRRTQDAADLNLAIETLQTAIDIISEAHPQRPHLLMQYGSVLQTRYLVVKDEDDLNLAIQQFQRVLASCPSDLLVPARRSLAMVLDQRAKLRYDNETVDLAIEAYASVIDLLPKDQLEYFLASVGYSTLLRVRFYRKGDLNDLDTTIRHSDSILKRCPPGHKHHFQTLVFHATLLIARSEAEPQGDSLEDVDKAIEYLRNGLEICPAGDPLRPELLGNLGYGLVFRFSNHGNATDLESAVESCYDAVSLQSDGSGEAGARAANMNRLAFTLFSRYQLQGDETDASRAKAYLQQALETCPLGDRNSALISTGGAVARRVSLNSMLSNGSDPDAQYLSVPASNKMEPTSPMSVRPFSPSESFSFPKPPVPQAPPSATSADSFYLPVGQAVGSPRSSTGTLVHLNTPPRALISDDLPPAPTPASPANPLSLTGGNTLSPTLFVANPDPNVLNPFVDPVKPEFAEVEIIRRPFTPTLDDELSVFPGDHVRVLQVFDDGWAFVEKLAAIQFDRNERGLIPVDCLREAGQALPSFLAQKRVSSYGMTDAPPTTH